MERADGPPSGVVRSIAAETSERAVRENEARLAGILHFAGEAIISIDEGGKIVLFNRRAEGMFGYEAAEVLGTPLARILPQRWGESHARHVSAFAAGDQDWFAREMRGEISGLRKSGEEFPAEASVSRVRVGGRVVLTALVRDLTAEKAAQAALAESKKQQRQSQKMEAIGNLAAGVAHDFNNLLMAIIGGAKVVERRLAAEDPSLPDVTEIRHAGESAAALTQRLLAFARKQELRPQVVDLHDTIGEVQSMLGRVIGEHVYLAVDPTAADSKIRVDPAQLDQVVVNLVINARDALPESGGTIRLETARVHFSDAEIFSHGHVSPGWYVVLSVSDDGSGIDEAILPHIFEPFYTTKKAGVGTGLGLPTVCGIVHQSGGAIAVESRLEEGTSFRLYFPAYEGQAPETVESLPISDSRGRGETILLVEDDPFARQFTCRLLEASGYQVVAADGPTEALEGCTCATGGADLLLTDVVMPDMSGKELAERLAVCCPDMKVLFMSGYSGEILSRHGVADEDVEVLLKPVDPDLLVQKVRVALDGSVRRHPPRSGEA